MGNTWFQFKQFRIEQSKAALKVGTDACILGAWAQHPAPKRILDIGTGTGLLALMLAQRYNNIPIDALEPDPLSAEQAAENFGSSPWQQNIQLQRLPVQQFKPACTYELIVCNPPFYPHHLKTADSRRNLALHQEELSFEELALACKRLLATGGRCYILLPPRQTETFTALALQQELFAAQQLFVQDKPHLPVHRVVSGFSTAPAAGLAESRLIIREPQGAYTAAYRELLKNYYLIF